VVKVKTSIYVDKELWEKFKSHASKNGIEITQMLEEFIRDELVEDLLDQMTADMKSPRDYEIDFEPVESVDGLVSELVRVMRDERNNSIS
jgi:hypothetical protein